MSVSNISPEILTFKPNKTATLLWSIGLWSLLLPVEIGAYWVAYMSGGDSAFEGLFVFWALLLVMAILLFGKSIFFLPRQGWLTLNSSGFELYSHLKSNHYRYKWEDVQGFFVTYIYYRYTKDERISFVVTADNLSQQKNFPVYRYNISVEELVQVLNSWKQQHTYSMGISGETDASLPLQVSEQRRQPVRMNAWGMPQKESLIDKDIEKQTGRWGCGLASVALILFIVFILIMDSMEESTFKFYNFQADKEPSLVVTVKNAHSEALETYSLPPIPYKHKVELRIPAPKRYFPILIQYSANKQMHCVKLRKHYTDAWGQMDAIWVNPLGGIEAYAVDFCKSTGRYSCRHIPNYVDVSDCKIPNSILSRELHKRNVSSDIHIEIKPLSTSDYKRLKEKTGFEFERLR